MVMYTLSSYQRDAARTLGELPLKQALTLGALGLAGESGEVCEPIKKHVFHGKPLNRAEIEIELGDVLWYLAALATTLGLDLGEIALHNRDKLIARYPNQGPQGNSETP